MEIIPILTAAVSGIAAAAAAIIVAVIQSRAQHNAVIAEIKKNDALQAQRMEQLEKKINEHNQLIERTYQLEKKAAVFENDLKVANHRLDDLERKGL